MFSLGTGSPNPLMLMYLLQRMGQPSSQPQDGIDPSQMAALWQLGGGQKGASLLDIIGRSNQTLQGPNPDGSAGYYGGGSGILGGISKTGHDLASIIGSPNQMLSGPQQSGQAGYMGGGSGLLGFLSGILSGNN